MGGTAQDVVAKAKEHHDKKSTLNAQFYISLLFFVENVLIAAVPLMLSKKPGSYYYMILTIVGLWVASILFKYIFYKLFGHPWKDLNGPTMVSYWSMLCGCLDGLKVFKKDVEKREEAIELEGINVENPAHREQDKVGQLSIGHQ